MVTKIALELTLGAATAAGDLFGMDSKANAWIVALLRMEFQNMRTRLEIQQ